MVISQTSNFKLVQIWIKLKRHGRRLGEDVNHRAWEAQPKNSLFWINMKDIVSRRHHSDDKESQLEEKSNLMPTDWRYTVNVSLKQ